jgi:hypothetical protein
VKAVGRATLAVFASGFFALLGASPSEARSPERGEPVAAPSCPDACNRKASDCLDVCEEKFKDDDKARVTCKFECATKRQQCEKDCG